MMRTTTRIRKTSLSTTMIAILVIGSGQSAPASTVVATFPPDASSDLDGDGVVYSSDNSPWAFNPTQQDDDADGIGQASDPDDTTDSNTSSDLSLNVGGPYNIAPGSTLDINLSLDAPAALNHILPEMLIYVRFQLDGIGGADAYLLPYDSTASIQASFFTAATWDLNTPGAYAFTATLDSRMGTWGSSSGTVNVVAVPESSTLALGGLGLVGLLATRRRLNICASP